MKLAMLAFLYCANFVKNSIVDNFVLIEKNSDISEFRADLCGAGAL